MTMHARCTPEKLEVSDVEIAEQLRRTMSRFASGVTVVTVMDGDGGLHGMTISSFCSVSLEPPLILISVAQDARTLKVLRDSGRFTVHVLGRDQADLAKHFASPGGHREAGVAWSANNDGFAILDRYHASILCSVHDLIVAGDHTLVIGRVRLAEPAGSVKAPLLYYRSAIGGLSWESAGGGT